MMLEKFLDAGRYFKSDYQKCRAQFLAASQQVGYLPREHNTWVLPQNLVNEELAIDGVWLGDPNAARVLVMISGTHGVEGYCGSAAQSFLLTELKQLTDPIPDNFAILMIHALNPWGMYWARRCDQDGIDLNRNFVDFNQLPDTDSRIYQVLEALALPQSERTARMGSLVTEWGSEAFERVVSEGQYQIPWAPFYGGTEPAFSARIIDQITAHWQLAQRELVVIDIHSGLGPWAYGELISDHAVGSAGEAFSHSLFGAAVANTLKGESFSLPKYGLMDFYWHAVMNQGCYLTLEFGTYPGAKLFEVLCADHLFWREQSGFDLGYQPYQPIRQAMLSHFCPKDSLWQQAILFKCWQVLNRVIEFYS